MKKIILSCAFLLLFSSSLTRKRPSILSESKEETCDQLAQKAFEKTNQFRESKGLSKLIWHQKVSDIACEHSMNMASKKVAFGHAGFEERVKKFPFQYTKVAENVFMGNHQKNIAQIAVDSWINSPGHLKNLIGPYKICGIGVYKSSEGYWYFTQLFASF